MDNKIDKVELLKKLNLLGYGEGDKAQAEMLLSKLGLLKDGAMNKEVRRMVRKMLPPEYNLVASITCMTCGTTTQQYFRMTQDEERWALVSVPLPSKPDEGDYKEKKSNTDRCLHCEEALASLDKDSLIRKIFEILDRTRRIPL